MKKSYAQVARFFRVTFLASALLCDLAYADWIEPYITEANQSDKRDTKWIEPYIPQANQGDTKTQLLVAKV